MTAGNQITTQTATPELAVEQLERLLPSLNAESTDKETAVALIGRLTVPVDPAWLMARVASLMLPYFEKDTPQSVREMAMDDWADALGEYPKWAINAAVKWWQSDGNPKRRTTPMHGDITERVKIEMGAVRAAKIMINAAPLVWPKREPEPEKPGPTQEERERMAAYVAAKGFPTKGW